MMVALHPGGVSPDVALPEHLQLQPASGCYLGIHVGSWRDAEPTWDVAERQLVTRLHMACCKSLSVDHRSAIAAAVIIPKLTFIGQHV
ncbi:hypothetical protein PC123_g26172 [Phytophthora cactorum]|nr:hypothetical protein PC123_g26172 [Phytophthora cactorum]